MADPVWTITGETGRNVDETEHTLEELHAGGAEVSFESLDSDKLIWSVTLATKAQFEEILPDIGQSITLHRDGTRYFTGIVTQRPINFQGSSYQAEVVVEGPWWWLSRIPLSSDIEDQAENATERTAYVFPTGSPRTNLMALVARAITLGAPISQGSMASAFSVPRCSLRNIPFTEAMAEMMRWLADGLIYIDYTQPGEPQVCMQRRGTASTVTINPVNAPCGAVNIRPRMDLIVEELKVFWARRETIANKRVTTWDSETAGAITSGLPRRQPALISGPEIDTYLPQDYTDSVVVRSSLLMSGGAVKGVVFAQYDERLKASGATNFGVGAFTTPTVGGGTFTLPAIATTITDSEGNAVPSAYNRYLTVGEARDWWTKAGIEHVKARISATIYSISTYPVPGTPSPPAWAAIMGSQQYAYTAPGGGTATTVYATTVSVSVVLVKTDWPVDTTLIRPEDYAFINPPAGLAANLLATQNWLPYEGTVGPIAIGEIPAGNLVGSVLNLSGFLGETANMRALISGYTANLRNKTISLRLGAPDRHAYRDIVNRFRQSGADNIVWLVDSVSGDPGENPPPDPELEVPVGPDYALTFNGDYLTYDGNYITFTP